MLSKDFSQEFRNIQQNFATSLLRDHFSQVESFGDLHALLSNDTIGPFLKQVKLKDVFKGNVTATLAPQQREVTVKATRAKRSGRMSVQDKALAKKRLLADLSLGSKSTVELFKASRQYCRTVGIAYNLLRELEHSYMVHRVAYVPNSGQPIKWRIGGNPQPMLN